MKENLRGVLLEMFRRCAADEDDKLAAAITAGALEMIVLLGGG